MSFLFNKDVNVQNEVEIKNDSGNPIPVVFPVPPSVVISSANGDAFSRLRVSEPFTLGDYKHLYGIDSNFIEHTENGGTLTFQSNQACARLTTTSNTASRVVHQSKFYHHYMPGKSQLILSSFNFYDPVSNVTKRTGYYDDNNGIYFEQTGSGVLNIVLRSYVSGSVVETRVPQSSWSVDKCNGTGASNFNMVINKTQLLFIDFQWLGVGKVRVGFAHLGQFIVAHEFIGSNNLPTVYMSTPNLPIRCELLNTGVTSGGYFDQICSTVMSEGGYVESGQDWAVASTPRALGSGATLPILAIRLKTTYQSYLNRMIVRLGSVNVFSDSGNIVYSIVKLPGSSALTGGPGVWTSVNTSSGVEYYAAATGYTGGDVMDNGFVGSSFTGGNKAGGSPGANIPSAAKKNYIVQNYDSTDSEIYLVVARNIDSKSTNVAVGMQWREIY
jgi:hypothetical protein